MAGYFSVFLFNDVAVFIDDFMISNTGCLISTPSNAPEQGRFVAVPSMDD